jgi:hypothetical protein
MVFPVVVLVFGFEEFSEEVLHGHWLIEINIIADKIKLRGHMAILRYDWTLVNPERKK